MAEPAGDFFRTTRKSPIVKGNPFADKRTRKGRKGKKVLPEWL